VADAATASSVPESRRIYALSGVIALSNPQDGYAILGEQGKATRLYHAGAQIDGAANGRVYQVFEDRVVLDFGGSYETLRLPRALALTHTSGLALLASASDDEPEAPRIVQESPIKFVSRAETVFGLLNAQRNNVGGKLAGMLLHPEMRYAREYDLRDGDVLTAVNGVEFTNTDELNKAVNSTGDSVTLSFLRDGAPHIVTLPVPE
jgi:type II secretion system protein C